MRSGNIFNWLGMKQEQDILSLATQHIINVLLCAKTFQEAVGAYSSGDKPAKDEAIRKVREYEHNADTMRVEMIRRISEGIVAPMDREELLKFALTVDRVADWTNGAARLLTFLERPLPKDIMENIRSSAGCIVSAIEDLKGAVDALLAGKNKEAIDLTLQASLIESQEDDRKHETLGKILKSGLPTPELLVAYNLSEHLEGITDKIKDASDFVRGIAIRSK